MTRRKPPSDPPPSREDLEADKREITVIAERIRQKVTESPHKAALLLGEWIRKPARSRHSRKAA